MSNINERIRELRTVLNLSQVKFGMPIGLSRDEVKNIEYGKTVPKDITIPIICEKFHVSESWLRTGEGEMFRPMDREEEIADLVSMLFKEEESSFRFRLIRALSKLDEEEWKVLEKIAVEIAEKKD